MPPPPPHPPIDAPVTPPPPPGPAPTEPVVNQDPPTPPSQEAPKGRLRVRIESSAGSFQGVVALVAADGKRLAQEKVSGDAAETCEFDKLPPGPCRAAFVPTQGGTPAWA